MSEENVERNGIYVGVDLADPKGDIISYSEMTSGGLRNSLGLVKRDLDVYHRESKHNPEIQQKIDLIFKYRAPSPEDVIVFNELSDAIVNLAKIIYEKTPECHNRTMAISALTQVRMFANAAVVTGQELKSY